MRDSAWTGTSDGQHIAAGGAFGCHGWTDLERGAGCIAEHHFLVEVGLWTVDDQDVAWCVGAFEGRGWPCGKARTGGSADEDRLGRLIRAGKLEDSSTRRAFLW